MVQIELQVRQLFIIHPTQRESFFKTIVPVKGLDILNTKSSCMQQFTCSLPSDLVKFVRILSISQKSYYHLFSLMDDFVREEKDASLIQYFPSNNNLNQLNMTDIGKMVALPTQNFVHNKLYKGHTVKKNNLLLIKVIPKNVIRMEPIGMCNNFEIRY